LSLELPPAPVKPRPRTLTKRLGYSAIRLAAQFIALCFFGLRVRGRELWPRAGGGLVCANHQSNFDPPLVGLTCGRHMNYLARDTLFRIPLLKQLITFLDAIPINREGLGLGGIKETLRRLKAGELVLIFPEGTRTHDGGVAQLKPGFISLARRSRVPLIPVGIDGAFQAWPRTSRFPRLSRLAVVIGEPITADQVVTLTDDALLAALESRIRACHAAACDLHNLPRT
jgi:1-acyl-sn-glycerol-3-phosphate acyltransferase